MPVKYGDMAKMTPSSLNWFLAFKLPSAWISGVRVTSINSQSATAKVRHRWINQNPFRSLYWATQGMAAELVTGILLIKKIRDSEKSISMLVQQQQGSFHKKGTGLISFECVEGELIDEAIEKAISTDEAQSITLRARGIDETDTVISEFSFQWGLKLRSKD